jgi:uroporphyrinogen-III synthase
MPRATFNGRRVLSFESRRATEIATLIRNFGGDPVVAPALREVPLSSNPDAVQFASRLIAGGFDLVVFLTGAGARALLSIVEPVHPRDAFLAALRTARVAARGPKPVAVLREWQVPVWVTAPEPNTWRELLAAISERWHELPPQPRVAVQEYGVANVELLQALEARGGSVMRVPVYRWSLPDDLQPLHRAIESIAAGEIPVVLFTTGVQAAHLFDIAETINRTADVRAGLSRVVVASIGPTTSDELRERGLTVDLEASHPKMGVLVTEAAERVDELLARKALSKPAHS